MSGRRRTYDGPERRASLRIASGRRLKGELALDLDSEILHLASGGMQVRMPFPLALGSVHDFTLVVEEAVVKVSGVVRSCNPLDEAGPAYGIGVEFQRLDGDRKRVLETFVQRRLEG